jgi:hypothetical protein
MDIPVERRHGAVTVRTSRRIHDGRMPGEDVLARLAAVCREFIDSLGADGRRVQAGDPLSLTTTRNRRYHQSARGGICSEL